MKLAFMSYTLARGEWGKNPDIPTLCRLARQLELDGIDWVGTYGTAPKEIKRVTDDFGLKNVCYTFGAPLQSPDSDTRRAGLDEVQAGIETAVTLGADKIMIVLPGLPDVPREESRRYALSALPTAVTLAADAEITVTIEHFPGAMSPFAVSADMNVACAAVPGLKITYDNGNVLMGGEAPADGYRNSAANVVHAHFKDWELSEDGTLGLDGRRYRGALVGEGLVDPKPCLEAMKAGGYKGYIDFEYEGSKYSPEEAMLKGIPPLRELMNAVLSAA